jgi:hypothetical protein
VQPGWRPADLDADDLEYALQDGADFLEHVVTGGLIAPVETSARLGEDEWAYADEDLEFSRDVGTPTSWHSATITRVVVTDQRLLAWVDGQWLTFAYDQVVEFRPDLADLSLVLELDGSPAVRLRGPQLPARAVLLASFLYPAAELVALPGFAPLLGAGR